MDGVRLRVEEAEGPNVRHVSVERLAAAGPPEDEAAAAAD